MNRGDAGSLGAGRWKTVALALLGVLAIGQSVVAGERFLWVRPGGSPVAIGHDVSGLVVRLSGGETIELGAGDEALLLVFDPHCAHTARMAEVWASWLADEGSVGHRTIAVSPGPLSAAVRYAQDRDWNVPVGFVESFEDGVDEHPLTSRTPWVFAIGADGRVVAEGHGIRLAEVAQAISHRRSGDHDGRGAVLKWWPASRSHHNERLHISELVTGEYVRGREGTAPARGRAGPSGGWPDPAIISTRSEQDDLLH